MIAYDTVAAAVRPKRLLCEATTFSQIIGSAFGPPKTKHLLRFCPHSELNPMLSFCFSWYGITSSAAAAAERRVEALNLIRQYYAFVLNAVSAQTKISNKKQ